MNFSDNSYFNEFVHSSNEEEKKPSALERIAYLCPTRYFRIYIFGINGTTIFIPDGDHINNKEQQELIVRSFELYVQQRVV